MEIDKPASRIVFIDEGEVSPNAYMVPFNHPSLWGCEAPPGRHGDGTTVTFADGSIKHWKWVDEDTIEYSRKEKGGLDDSDNWDIYRMQTAVWGPLNWTPNPDVAGVCPYDPP